MESCCEFARRDGDGNLPTIDPPSHGWIDKVDISAVEWMFIQQLIITRDTTKTVPIGSMYGIYANIWGIWMVNVTIYSIHGSYGVCKSFMS